ncbi:MAG: VTT domain-containing protein [Muribaculaceae bacterium]|nr:VTT domain-containing protein [Muribaculaceae bacterium]MCM1556387.1 VTT domain-containing protein [Anaeroplasma bactoclasticum]
MTKRNLWIVIVNSIIGITLILALALCLNHLEWYLQIVGYFCVIAFTLGDIIAFILNKQSIVKSLFLFNVVAFIVIGSLAILNLCGVFDNMSDLEKVKQLILDSGSWGYVIYALLTILNVVVLPIPALIMMLAGVAVFGAPKTFIISYISVMIGSAIAFIIGRYAGKRLVTWCIGEEAIEKYTKLIGKKGNALFVIMQLLPFFPDDILCMIAGLTSMSSSFFMLSMLIVKPIYIATVCFMGTGSVIPFSGWGIPVWIAIFIITGVAFILFCKYQSKFEKWLSKFQKKK